jgi:hypothetical protein
VRKQSIHFAREIEALICRTFDAPDRDCSGALLAQLAAADEPPPLLHPRMADVYRTNVAELAAALQRPGTRLEPSETLRGLIDRF